MAGKTFIDKMLHFIGWEDVDREEDEQTAYTSSRRPSSVQARPASSRTRAPHEEYRQPQREKTTARPENVVNFRQESQRQSTVIYRISKIEETTNIISDLIENKTILFNLEDLEDAEAQRVNDILSGAAFALKATFVKTSHKAYLIAPTFVKVDNTKGHKI